MAQGWNDLFNEGFIGIHIAYASLHQIKTPYFIRKMYSYNRFRLKSVLLI